MSKVKINLVDQTLIGNDSLVAASAKCGTGEDNYRHPKLVEYVRNKDPWDGISYFTDKALPRAAEVESKYKVGLILEAWILDPQAYKDAVEYEDHFDYIFTYNPELLKKNPDKYKFAPSDTISVDLPSVKIHDKNKLVTMMYSKKAWLPGHQSRQVIADKIIPSVSCDVDIYGYGPENHVQYKSEGINDYMFSIEVENSYLPNYFTEKPLDCFATGTVPIYHGCPNIGDWFDTDGIITFTTGEELVDILNNLSPQMYKDRLSAVKANYEKALNYLEQDDNLYEDLKRFGL
tara:strand:+ start:3277 stop:4146 length:870 start_codon:yes stop_codon:yes gene_type:complete